MRGGHRLLDRAEQVRAHSFQVDLIAKPDGEAVEYPRGVIARTVEAAIDDLLYPAPQWLKERDDDERRDRHGEPIARGDRRER